ncbi:hypothetical protein DP067_03595 [Mycoplasmopsis anatis]|uniref:Uncharacterized protein n=1 Tax=Mycoplasmopsis anatis 1340 TaxID=1034808 RepID=F9QCK8_9BACT|nr:hypothetical protein [Mycoplasmopsis anatis]AWX70411.1 hypothetical protein DP067_03595 [Mycoplasmopsis anatis]EGS29504.1 hypothetical protein GIG_00822 [Mycoplasmopsis anatis 1340]QRI44001.1 hypothetical protein [Mycoplasma phage sp.]VEU73934.1 Uncharacterised protein [Mycoplasmopsis anatis]
MKTINNIEEILYKVRDIFVDVRYELLRNKFSELPNIESMFNERKENIKKFGTSNINCYFDDYFKEIGVKNKPIESVNNFIDISERVKRSLPWENDSVFVDCYGIINFLNNYIFNVNKLNIKSNDSIKNNLLNAIKEIGINNNKITIHMLEVNGEYVPFTNVFALCCYLLICLDKQGYKLKLWNMNSENKGVWEQICEKITKNKFVFKIYNSQEEINQKFYKKYLLTDNQEFGINYGCFINIVGNIFNRLNFSTKNAIFKELDWLKKWELIFQCVFNKKLIYSALKQWFILDIMFDSKTITKLPKYAFEYSYWKELLEKIGNALPFDIPKEDLKFNVEFRAKPFTKLKGFITLDWISDKKIISSDDICGNKIDIIIEEKLINESKMITNVLIEKLIDINFINVINLMKKYELNSNKINENNQLIIRKINDYLNKLPDYKYV